MLYNLQVERYSQKTRYVLVKWIRPSTGEVVEVFRAVAGIDVVCGGFDSKEDINHQTYGGAGDIYLDTIYAPQAYGVPRDEIRQE